MAELISLNRARKARDKAAAKADAAVARVAFGRTKAERLAAQKVKADAARDLDGKKRD